MIKVDKEGKINIANNFFEQSFESKNKIMDDRAKEIENALADFTDDPITHYALLRLSLNYMSKYAGPTRIQDSINAEFSRIAADVLKQVIAEATSEES